MYIIENGSDPFNMAQAGEELSISLLKKESALLDDLLKPNLQVVFCGTAAGSKSAARSEYYAGTGNKFWSVLYEIGLTSERLSPSEYRRLLEFGIGLTDIVKDQAGMDSEIEFSHSDSEFLSSKITRYSPRIIAFNGKRAAQVFLKENKVSFGLQHLRIGSTRLFVAPSTSGAANGYWDFSHWTELAELVRGAN